MKSYPLRNKIRNHVLVQTFLQLKGNPKWSICTEPLWFIPYSLFSPYQALYMRKIGLSSLEIGTTLSLGFLLQVFFAFIGGALTDKMGRRKATVIFDTISWSIPCFIWAFSQNFWHFLIAAAINASFQITNTSWNCLFIEDCPPEHITNAFTLIQICGMLSVFFAPLSIWLLKIYDLVSVFRVIFFISGISMTAKFVLLYRFGGETRIGRQRMEETRNMSYFSMLTGYKDIFFQIIRSSRMRLVVYIMTLTNILLIATTNFFSLYITESLHISEELVAVFPLIRTIIMILFVVFLQNLFHRLRIRNSMIIGFFIYIASHILLILCPEKNLLLVMLYTILESSAYAIVIPRKDALMALFVDEKERSRIYALYNMLMIGLSVPLGSLIGWFYDLDPSYPFYFNICVFFLGLMILSFSKDLKQEKH